MSSMRLSVSVVIVLIVSLSSCMVRRPPLRPAPPLCSLAAEDWSGPEDWRIGSLESCTLHIASEPGAFGDCMRVDFRIPPDGGWVQLSRKISPPLAVNDPVTFLIKAPDATGNLEIKFLAGNGSVFGVKFPLHGQFREWTRITVYRGDLGYWWGGNAEYDALHEFHFALSGGGEGTVWFDDVGRGEKGLLSSFDVARDGKEFQRWEDGRYIIVRGGPVLDSNRDFSGTGFIQRRASDLIPENPLVLEWLKILQDVSSPARQMLPTSENNQCHTFNNALVAQAFLLKDEKERAERILDFFARRTDPGNADPTDQQFFYKGEARGFFQHCELNPTGDIAAYHDDGTADRWVGDNVWLLFAYKYYAQKYGPDRYRRITRLLEQLLKTWYIDSPDVPGGGYVRHGWRKGDEYLHESFGHGEGNVDCYAAFKLCGEDELAEKVRIWLNTVTQGDTQPLDIYTWQVLAYDGDRRELLDIPDGDLRYRKTVTVNGIPVTGPYPFADITVNNIWLDGLGHIACGFAACDNKERAFFYANQFDPFLQESSLGGKSTLSLPYTANEQGGYNFDQSKGIISAAAWYIFAKNGFNPMRLTQAEPWTK